MADEFTRYWDDTPVVPAAPPEPIHAAPKPLLAPRATPVETGASRLYVNDERNSRAGRPLGLPPAPQTPRYVQRWKSDLREGLRPYVLAAAGDRILVYGPSLWSLFDAAGRLVQTSPLGASGVVLDPPHSLFFAADTAGLIVGYRLGDGQSAFSLFYYYGDRFGHSFLARRDRRLIAVGTAKDIDPHEPPPEESSIEVVDLGESARPKSWDQPDGPVVVKDLFRKTRLMRTAMAGDVIALATKDRVFLLDLDLEIRRAMTGSFVPLEISLDEGGRIYLLVNVAGRNALWLLTPAGEMVYSFEFPPGVRNPSVPAIVGYDHTAYILAGRHILSVAPDGKLNWMRSAMGEVAGAVVTADDFLLASEGDSLVAWDAQGQRRVVHALPGEQLATAPVLTAEGDLLVATQAHLYRLGRVPAR